MSGDPGRHGSRVLRSLWKPPPPRSGITDFLFHMVPEWEFRSPDSRLESTVSQNKT